MTKQSDLEQFIQTGSAAILTAIEAAMEGIAILSSNGAYMFLNQAHAALYGFNDPAELIGKSWQFLYAPDERKRFQEDIFPRFMEKGKWRGEAVGRRKDGTSFSQELSLVLTEDGGIVCVVSDISERKRQKQIEQQLKTSEESYRQFTNLTSDFVHICSRSGAEPFRIQWTGGALNSISGYSAEEIFELGCFIPFVHSDDREKISAELGRMVPGDVKILDFRIVSKQGEVRWIAQKCRCEKGAGESELLLYSSIRDITDRKQMEETLHRTFAELQRHDKRMRLLHEMNDKLLSVESRKEVCAVIIDSAAKLFPTYSGVLAICPANCSDFKIETSWGNDFDMDATFTINDCWALQGKESHRVCDPSQSLGCKIFQGRDPRAVADNQPR